MTRVGIKVNSTAGGRERWPAQIDAVLDIARRVAEEWSRAEDGYHFRLGQIRFRLVVDLPQPTRDDCGSGCVTRTPHTRRLVVVA